MKRLLLTAAIGLTVGLPAAVAAPPGADWPLARASTTMIAYRHGHILTVRCRDDGTPDAPIFDCVGVSFLPQLLGAWTYRITPLTPSNFKVSRLARVQR